MVIMDVRMEGMDGVTTVRRIRQSSAVHNRIPIVALTADVTKETKTKCMAAGVNVFLTKPIRAADLYDAIAAASEQHKSRPKEEPRRHSA